jgi:hypothetical protein
MTGETSFLSEMFPSNLRYSGASLGYQLAAPIGGGLVPLAAGTIVGLTHGATWPVSLLMIAIAFVTILERRRQKSRSCGRRSRDHDRGKLATVDLLGS